MVQTILALDICLYLFRRFIFTTFHKRLRNVFITVLVIQGLVALTKAVVNYIVTTIKDSKDKSSEQDANNSSNHPNLRIVK